MAKKNKYKKLYKEKNKKKKRGFRFDFNKKGVIFFVAAAFILSAITIIGTDMGWLDQGGIVSSLKRNSADAPVMYGELISKQELTEKDHAICNLTVKIQAKRTQQQTVEQNYYNAVQFIRNNSGKFDEIHYTAVAENSGGQDVEAVSFTLEKELIESIEAETTEALQIPEQVSDLYILSTLKTESETVASEETEMVDSESESNK